ncbi:hypothetical protein E3N88_10995 [Mikania micrantha]|uniref:Uncharacterized protein n=1 Tax=Mikania micrantha TaxID=192012 RepID=A0A5N6PE88_9ASTR|nr:hypothetical protein E3N88_10995 [Mikania micrantha]
MKVSMKWRIKMAYWWRITEEKQPGELKWRIIRQKGTYDTPGAPQIADFFPFCLGIHQLIIPNTSEIPELMLACGRMKMQG